MTTPTAVPPTELHATIRAYLAARTAGDPDAAARTFGPEAVVVDEGQHYRGTEEVLHFLRRGGGGYTYTFELLSAERLDDTHWVAVNRLEGNFPGGLVDLRHSFTLEHDLISELVIVP